VTARVELAGELTPAEIQRALSRPRDFGWRGDTDETFHTWALGPVIRHRNSGLLDESNAATMERWLTEAAERGEIEPDSWRVVSCSHWAVGWVEHLSYRVVGDDGRCTRVARWVRGWDRMLDDYPVADEGHYGDLTTEAEHGSVRQAAWDCLATRDLIETLPAGWESYVASALHDAGAMRSDDDCGGWPASEEALIQALHECGYLDAETTEAETEEEG
jgi:hypothetical protein